MSDGDRDRRAIDRPDRSSHSLTRPSISACAQLPIAINSYALRPTSLRGLVHELLHTEPFGERGEINRARLKPVRAPNSRRIQAQEHQSEFRTLVGGPGFEPGASRSRNLSGLVHRDRFRRFSTRLGASHGPVGRVSSPFEGLDYYMNYYMIG
jgi:hypothetical protein